MKILLVDDDSDDTELFTQAVNEIDPLIQIDHAKDGQHALEILEADINLPSIIFLDVNMPKVRHNDNIVLAKKLGAIDFMEKPYHFSVLKKQILNGLRSVLSE